VRREFDTQCPADPAISSDSGVMQFSISKLVLLSVLIVSHLVACGESSPTAAAIDGGAGSPAAGGGGGTSSSRLGDNIGGMGFNQCGVAAPLPASTGQCTTVSAPTLTDFDDYAGTAAASYTFYVNAKPPATDAVLGAIQHIGDGSDQNGGTSVIATEMVTGADGTSYALEFSNTNATTWGGLLMFYLIGDGTSVRCLDASSYSGLEFSIKGMSPSGRFGVSLGMLDTMPSSDKGLCANATAADCKDASVELALPANTETWAQIQVPFSAFTPGIGSGLSCIPVTGQNIARLVIQPFMSYPPPNYTFAPGPYSVAVDNVRFY
jgi:hypothetical protein